MEDYGIIGMNKKSAAITILILLSILLMFFYFTYRPLSGTVIDAETGAPLAGAVVHVEWNITMGLPGLSYGQTYKKTEKITDDKGRFSIFGTLNPFVSPPVVVVYKKGYAAWRNDYVFPDFRKREDFTWGRHKKFSLSYFERGHLHSQHLTFIRTSLSLDTFSQLDQAFSDEIPLAEKERDLFSEKLPKIKQGDKDESEIWREITRELYPHEENK